MESYSVEPKKGKSIEEISKDELLVLFEKLKAKTLQLSQTKTDLEQQLENSQNEKDDIRKKAQQVVLRCKNLEKKVIELETTRNPVAYDGVKEQDADDSKKELLQQANKDITKYKVGVEQLAQKFRTLKTAYEAKESELEVAMDKIAKLESEFSNIAEIQVVENGPSIASSMQFLQEELQSLRNQNAENNTRSSQIIHDLREKLVQLERSGELRQVDFDRVTTVYTETQDRLERVQAELSAESVKCGELASQASQLREALEGRESEISASASRVSEMERELTEVRSELAAVLSQVGEKGKTSTARDEEVSSLQSLLSSEREKLADMEKGHNACCEDRDARILDLEDKLYELKYRDSETQEKLEESMVSLKEKSNQVLSLQKRVTEIEKLYESRCAELNFLSGSYEEVNSQLQEAAQEVLTLRHQQSDLQQAVERWERQCDELHALIKDNEKETDEEASILQSKLNSWEMKYQKAPWRFAIVLRVRENGLDDASEGSKQGNAWCLLQRRDSVGSEPYYQWQEDATVVAWVTTHRAQRTLQKETESLHERAKEAVESDETEVPSFSISGQDDDEDNGEENKNNRDICSDIIEDGEGILCLPDALQDISNRRMEIMKKDLQHQIEVLRGEVETNRIAFDRYRARAKETLRASIADQKELEIKLAAYKEEVKQDLQSKEKLEKWSRSLEMQIEEQQHDNETKLRAEHQKWIDIAENLSRLEDENMKLQQLLTSLQYEHSQSRSHSEELEVLNATHKEEMAALTEELHKSRKREGQLEKEMKKRGDAARQMLTDKDKDIDQLHRSLASLQGELKQLQERPSVVPSTPTSARVDGIVGSNEKRARSSLSEHSSDPRMSDKLDDILSTEEKRIFEDVHQHPNASQTTKLYEGVYRHARLREAELLDIIKMLKNEVNLMRKRFSLIRSERQHFHSSSSNNLMNSSFPPQQSHQHHPLLTPRKTAVTSHTSKNSAVPSLNTNSQTATANEFEFESDVPVDHYIEDDHRWADEEDSVMYDPEQEARLVYLKQAFSGFFRAKNPVEMQHLGRVICAILGVDIEEQGAILEGITKLSPAVVATTTIDSITQQIASIFS